MKIKDKINDFRHFLITRVNIGYLDRIYPDGINPEIWLYKRITIFKEYCFPSIINQTNKNFTWLLYFDERTPNPILRELKEFFNESPFIIIKTMEGSFGNLKTVLKKDIMDLLTDEKFIITSRVDTDDMLNKFYIEKVQSFFNCQKYVSINFSKGLVYDTSTGLIGATIQKSNAFISLIEKIESRSPKTVYYKLHREYLNDTERLEIKNSDYMWVVSVHGLNVSSGFFARPIFFSRIDLYKNFNFKNQKYSSLKIRLVALIKFFKRKSKKVFPFFKRKLRL
jgi:hypothetical protein